MPSKRKPLLRIIYECNNYLLINKPPNVLSQPGNVERWLYNVLYKNQHVSKPKVLLDELRAQSKSSEKEAKEWRLVHRLDKCVTGGLIVAKNKNAAMNFSRNLKYGGNKGFGMERKYVAMVKESSDDVKYLNDYGVIDKMGMISKYKRFDERCIVLELVTGQKHQIRQHLSRLAHQPILNDLKYSGDLITQSDPLQIALHSACVKTKIGLHRREHLIPMTFQNDGTLWNRRYLRENGQFIPEIQKILLEDWDF